LTTGLLTTSVPRGKAVSFPDRCASCGAQPVSASFEIRAVPLASNVLLAIPLAGIAILGIWIAAESLETSTAIFGFLGFILVDLILRFIRLRGATVYAVPHCGDCAGKRESKAWARSWWSRVLAYATLIVAYLVVERLLREDSRALRMSIWGLLCLTPGLLDFISRETRPAATALLVGDRVDLTFSNEAYARDVRAMNHGPAGAG